MVSGGRVWWCNTAGLAGQLLLLAGRQRRPRPLFTPRRYLPVTENSWAYHAANTIRQH